MAVRIRLEAIVPKKQPVYDLKEFQTAMKTGLMKTSEAVEADFKKTTRTWKTSVRFTSRYYAGTDELSVSVGTSNAIYQIVNDGALPHLIVARRGRLSFSSRYRAKTTPGLISSRQGGSGPIDRYRRSVHHPGHEGRRWDVAISRRHIQRRTLERNVQREIRRAAERRRE